jgi:hypothetical protein
VQRFLSFFVRDLFPTKEDKMKVVEALASALSTMRSCEREEMADRAKERVGKIQQELLLSGSGNDAGSEVLVDLCSDRKIVIQSDFHHMDENGFYSGWTKGVFTITPSFHGIEVKFVVRGRPDIKYWDARLFIDYQEEQMFWALNKELSATEQQDLYAL